MANGQHSYLPIRSEELEKYMSWADPVMSSVSWKPSRNVKRIDKGVMVEQISTDAQASDTLSLFGLSKEISGGSPILTTEVNQVVVTIRNALCLGLHLTQVYQKQSGLDTLQEQNRIGKMSAAQHAEFNGKTTSASAIAVFTVSAYIVHTLSTFENEKVAALKLDFGGIPELSLSRGAQPALTCLLYHFAQYCKTETGVVQNGLDFVKLAILYFEAAMNDVHDKEKSFSFEEPFTEVGYRLEGSSFVVEGFKIIKHAASISAEFKKVSFDEIVGNRRAKHLAIRTTMMMCCYDLERKKNPYLELGSFPLVGMGEGIPGTGKSLMIAATATLLQELCDKINLPFHFCPMPATIVSTFQGGSAERMEDWMRHLAVDDRIVYGPIDDAENLLMNRTKEGVSAGVREVISVFLRNTEGASAIIRGNAKVELYTNLPELIDAAVLSRIQSRAPIEGALTFEDFIDQNHLWLRRFEKLDKGFVGLGNKSGYKFLSAQKPIKNLAELQADVGSYKVKDSRIADAIVIAGKKFPTSDQGYFAQLYVEVKRLYPNFSSRDVRNIQTAVDARILDFDLPHEWLDDPKLFYHLGYDAKVELLRQELKKNMKGLNLEQILIEEVNRYLDTMARISFIEYEREVEAYLKRLKVVREAEKRFSLPTQRLE